MHGRKTSNAHYPVGFKIFAIIFEKVIFALVLHHFLGCLVVNKQPGRRIIGRRVHGILGGIPIFRMQADWMPIPWNLRWFRIIRCSKCFAQRNVLHFGDMNRFIRNGERFASVHKKLQHPGVMAKAELVADRTETFHH